MWKVNEMNLKIAVGRLEISRLVYAKYLLNQGKKFLENSSVEAHFNISVILAANAAEVFIQTFGYCYFGEDRTDEKISTVLKTLKKEIKTFPDSEFNRVIIARNGIYHRVELKTYKICMELVETTRQLFVRYCTEYFGIEYDSLSMVDLVEDEQLRSLLKSSEKYIQEGNNTDAVLSTTEAFAMLKSRIDKRGRYQVKGRNSNLLSGTEVSWKHMEKKLGIEKRNFKVGEYDSQDMLGIFSDHVEEQVNKKIQNLAHYINFFLMLGSHYEDYKHFEAIKPLYHMTLGGFRCKKENIEKNNYSPEDIEFMFNFVLAITLDIEPWLRPIHVRNLNKDILQTIK